MPKFYGVAYEEHYSKEIKDFTVGDWIISIIYLLMILGSILIGIMGHWGILTIMVGLDIIMIDVFLRLVIHVKSKILPYFDGGSLFVIAGGVILVAGHKEYIFTYGIFVAGLAWLLVGVLCTKFGMKQQKKIKEYSLIVKAKCELVDAKKTNVFRFDDINSSYQNPINANTLMKPGFRYTVNGTEYFTESTVYYGDGNYGYEEGKEIDLRVNPKNPMEVLPRNESSFVLFLMGFFGWFFAIVIFIIVAIMFATGNAAFYF